MNGATASHDIAVAAYLVTAWLCYRNWRCSIVPADAAEVAILKARASRRFWLMICIALIALGVSRQFDMLPRATAYGRQLAMQQGWYGSRRGIQREFIAAVALFGMGGVVALPLLARHAGGWAMAAGVALAALVAFIVIRAASLHDLDAIIYSGWAGIRVNYVVELGAIAVVALSALGFRRHLPT